MNVFYNECFFLLMKKFSVEEERKGRIHLEEHNSSKQRPGKQKEWKRLTTTG